jgi:hypothetical protein
MGLEKALPGRLSLSIRCRRRIVSGVTIVATCSSILRPRILPLTANQRPLVIVEQNALLAELLSEHTILGPKVLDHVLLLAIDPAGQDQQLPGCRRDFIHSPDAVCKEAASGIGGLPLQPSKTAVASATCGSAGFLYHTGFSHLLLGRVF